MRSFQKLVASTVLAATATLGVVAPLAGKATPSPGEDWAYVTNSEHCVPKFSVSDNVVDGTIVVQVVQGNTCPVSNSIFLFIQDDGRPQPLRIPGTRENILSSTWVFHPGDARPGRYRVIGIAPTPSGIGDYNYVSSRDLGIDQVITIGVVGSRHPVSDPPPLRQNQQVVTTLDSESKQLLRNFDQWMLWLQVNIWPQLQPLIRAIESIKTS